MNIEKEDYGDQFFRPKFKEVQIEGFAIRINLLIEILPYIGWNQGSEGLWKTQLSKHTNKIIEWATRNIYGNGRENFSNRGHDGSYMFISLMLPS